MLNNIDDLSEAVQGLQKAVADARPTGTPGAPDEKNAQAERERLEHSLETFGAALKRLEQDTQKQQGKTYHASTAKSGDSMKRILSDMLSEHRKISGAIGDMRKDIEGLREYQLKNRQTVTI